MFEATMADDQPQRLGKIEPGTKMEERRRHPRVPVNLSVRIRFPSVDEFLSAHSEDLSSGGLFVNIEGKANEGVECRVGDVIVLRIDVGGGQTVDGIGRVVRAVPAGAISPRSVAIEFIDLDAFN